MSYWLNIMAKHSHAKNSNFETSNLTGAQWPTCQTGQNVWSHVRLVSGVSALQNDSWTYV